MERFGNNSMWSLAVLNVGALPGMKRQDEAAIKAEDIGNMAATVVVLLECTEVHLQALRSAEDMVMEAPADAPDPRTTIVPSAPAIGHGDVVAAVPAMQRRWGFPWLHTRPWNLKAKHGPVVLGRSQMLSYLITLHRHITLDGRFGIFELRFKMAAEPITIAVMHFEASRAKIPGARGSFFQLFVIMCKKYKVRIICGDANMAMWSVPYHFSLRGVQCTVIAQHCELEDEKLGTGTAFPVPVSSTEGSASQGDARKASTPTQLSMLWDSMGVWFLGPLHMQSVKTCSIESHVLAGLALSTPPPHPDQILE